MRMATKVLSSLCMHFQTQARLRFVTSSFSAEKNFCRVEILNAIHLYANVCAPSVESQALRTHRKTSCQQLASKLCPHKMRLAWRRSFPADRKLETNAKRILTEVVDLPAVLTESRQPRKGSFLGTSFGKDQLGPFGSAQGARVRASRPLELLWCSIKLLVVRVKTHVRHAVLDPKPQTVGYVVFVGDGSSKMRQLGEHGMHRYVRLFKLTWTVLCGAVSCPCTGYQNQTKSDKPRNRRRQPWRIDVEA